MESQHIKAKKKKKSTSLQCKIIFWSFFKKNCPQKIFPQTVCFTGSSLTSKNKVLCYWKKYLELKCSCCAPTDATDLWNKITISDFAHAKVACLWLALNSIALATLPLLVSLKSMFPCFARWRWFKCLFRFFCSEHLWWSPCDFGKHRVFTHNKKP